MHRLLLACLTFLALAPLLTFAAMTDAEQAKSQWAGSNAQLGGILNTGNTKNKSVTGKLHVQYAKKKIQNITDVSGQYGKDNNVASSQNITTENSFNYSLGAAEDSNNFINNDNILKTDRFSAYDYELTTTLGYGHHWMKSDKIDLSTTLGPGYRRNELTDTKVIDDEIVLNATSHLCWNASETVKVTEDAKNTFGEEYNYTSLTTAITSTLFKQVALSLSFKMEYYSSIPADTSYTDKLNTLTTLNLVYPF